MSDEQGLPSSFLCREWFEEVGGESVMYVNKNA